MALDNRLLLDIRILMTRVPDQGSLEERLTTVMTLVKNGNAGLMFVTTEDEEFRVSVGAVMAKATEDEKEIISTSMELMNALSALLSGIPVDMEAAAARAEGKPTVRLLDIWKGISR